MAPRLKCFTWCIFSLLLSAGTPFRMTAQAWLRQPVDFSCQTCLPEKALLELSRQAKVNIAFNNYLFENCPPLEIAVSQKPLHELIKLIGECPGVVLRVKGDQILLDRKIIYHTLNGYVVDEETGERLIGAAIRLANKMGAGAVSNEFGFFSLRLEAGEHTLVVTHLGHKTDKIKVTLNENQTTALRLKQDASLPTVEVLDRPNRTGPVGDGTPPNRTLSAQALRRMPSPGGEPDLLRQTALQAGVQTGTDGLGGLHVRGGNADQNLILLDDVPVYNPGHALGLFSIFNPSTVSNTRFWKGDQPARYGGRAASVLDIRTRDGNAYEHHITASVGLFATSLTVEGPTVREKGSFLLGIRNTYFEPWVHLLSKRGNLLLASGKNSDYRFYDINLKANHAFSNRDRLFFTFYRGGDDFSNRFSQLSLLDGRKLEELYTLSTNWGNAIAALRWNRMFRKNLFANTTLRFSKFIYQSRQTVSATLFRVKPVVLQNFGQSYQTYIGDWSGKMDFTWYANERTTLRWGGSYTLHDFRPGAISVNFQQAGASPDALDSLSRVYFNNEKLIADEGELYIDADWQPWAHWRVEAGVNATTFQTKSVKFKRLQPRFRIVHLGRKGFNQWAGLHRLGQNLHQIGSYSVSLPFELWVPSTPKVLPQLAWQASVGLGQQYRHWSWQVEAYYKRLDRVHTFLSFNDALFSGGAEDASGWQDRIATGTGRGRGIELVVEKNTGRLTGSVAYTLSDADRHFPDLNSGRAFPFRFDRRHDIKLNLRQRLNKRWDLELLWVFATGNPITLAGVKYEHESVDDQISRTVNVFTAVNGYRLPNYHRFDFSFNWHVARKRSEHLVQMGLYNTYNRANPFFVYIAKTEASQNKGIAFTLLPILPILRYELSL